MFVSSHDKFFFGTCYLVGICIIVNRRVCVKFKRLFRAAVARICYRNLELQRFKVGQNPIHLL